MTFLTALILGLFLGYKLRGAMYIYKETRNVRFIKEVVSNIMGEAPLEIIQSKEDLIRDKVAKASEKHFKRVKLNHDDELEDKIAELQEMFDERGY